MLWTHSIPFDPLAPAEALAALPPQAAVFALRGETGEPYLNQTTDLRRRVTRLLTPAPAQSKRLALAGLVRHIEWAPIASDFAAQLLLYQASALAFGDRAAKRLHLHAPYFLRMGMPNRFPRLWVTNNVKMSAAADLFGPFPSRNAAERYAEQVLDLFLLRRCFQDLDPDPAFPGCIYSEIKKCLAPCYAGCTDARYAEEARDVHAFLRTRGASLLASLGTERDRASEALDFEKAAAAHTRYGKLESVIALAPEIAHALQAQHAVLVQPATEPDSVELYLLAGGVFAGPVLFSLLGMRLHNEQSGSSSLFSHPAAVTAVPLGPAAVSLVTENTPDARLAAALTTLKQQPMSERDVCEHQALFARWYFRPQHRRTGELVPAEAATGTVAVKPLLRACARVYRAYVEQHASQGTAKK